MAQTGEVSDQVTFGDVGQLDRLRPHVLGRHQFLGPPLGHPRRPQLPAAPAGLRQFEECRFGRTPTHDGRARRPPARRRHRTTLSSVRTNPSTSARVRRSVTATSNPARGVVSIDGAVALVTHQIGQRQAAQIPLVGQPFDGDPAGDGQAHGELAAGWA